MTDASQQADEVNVVLAIRAGDVETLTQLLAARPGLARDRLEVAGGRTSLHVVADWPGFFRNGPRIARILIDAGAELDARSKDGTGETPLHWAASSDDADVARILIDAGADVAAPDGSIGTPLDNAIGYGCWNVARLLVASGAEIDKPWQAAALGLTGQLVDLLGGADPGPGAVDQAFWHACAAGQRRCAELLLDRGADLAFSPEYGSGTVLDVARSHGTQRSNVIEWLEGLGVPAEHAPR
ncbi:ankyrin repeat domain-containing protein [Nocardioides terrisoli]|uniref:ankyrin repeat domain-containing protein n=1 Tax=Nocardioides terrisoli TaxID=3388267 RepID=UPI00287B6E0C|nr:ankyrin repeat domain-containing protein [Nocardioides marmorisolisilvae]